MAAERRALITRSPPLSKPAKTRSIAGTEVIVSDSGPQIEAADPFFNWAHTPSNGGSLETCGGGSAVGAETQCII